MENFEDKINQILLVAAIVSVIIGLIKEGFPDGLVDGISIALALIIITVVSSFNNYISERKLAELVEINNVKRPVCVIR
jgi:magnesium-transporting ATPase (P-type)